MPQQAPVDITGFEIVGYANVLVESVLPSVVSPIFRSGERNFVPPYTFNGRYLCEASEIEAEELQAFAQRRDITLFPQPFPAKPGHELWIGQDWQAHYQPRLEAKRRLREISSAAAHQAKLAFQSDDLNAAEQHSNLAMLANEENLLALAVKVAIARTQRRMSRERVLLQLADPSRRNELETFIADLQAGKRRSPMKDMATHKSMAA